MKKEKKISISLRNGGLKPQHHCHGEGNDKTWSPNQHKLNIKGRKVMVDVMVKSKKDKPLKLISLEIMNNPMIIVQIKRIDLSKKRFYYLVPIF